MSLYVYDKLVAGEGYGILCGVDEAGRGPLAGPVFAAAVILPGEYEIEGLNDSKKLTEKKREALYDLIVRHAASYSIAAASEGEIDEINILQASLLAMRRAVEGLGLTPDCILADGNQDPQIPHLYTRTVVKGDGTSACIAAASILAKVARDRYMVQLDRTYPQYQFAAHKGYPTKLHYRMLDEYGSSPVHRKSFLLKWNKEKGARDAG